MEFLADNPVLVLSLVGAALALAASLTTTVSAKPPARLVAILTVLGFLVVVAQQLISAALDAQSEEDQKVVEEARKEIMQAIQLTVNRTEGVVTSINDRLRGKDLSSLGDKLIDVAVGDDAGGESVDSLPKEAPDAWPSFAGWVNDNRGKENVQLCMSLELDAGRNYRPGMVLGWLLTGPSTVGDIRQHAENDTWDAIANADFVDNALLNWEGVDCVLLYEGRAAGGNLIAYGTAESFALELLLLQRVGRGGDVEQLLNRRGPPSVAELKETFPSLRTSILESDDVNALVQAMISEQWPEIVSNSDQGQFLLALERVVRTAAQKGTETDG